MPELVKGGNASGRSNVAIGSENHLNKQTNKQVVTNHPTNSLVRYPEGIGIKHNTSEIKNWLSYLTFWFLGMLCFVLFSWIFFPNVLWDT